jgi:hypothetical protein
MRSTLAAVALAVLAAPAPASLHAQQVPNLSGTWVLQTDKSDFGMMPAPKSRIDVIDHQEPKLNIKRTVSTSAGDTTSSNLIYQVDGKPYKNMVGPNELSSILHWEGTTLVMATTVETPNGTVTITDRYTLSADGKTIAQARTFSTGGQDVGNQTMLLLKQP